MIKIQEGMKIEELSKMTREEFIEQMEKNNWVDVYCPSDIGLYHECEGIKCKDCWLEATENIKFRSDNMDFNKYEKEASRTMKESCSKKESLIEGALGLAGEAGEVVDLIKKFAYQGHELKEESVIDELGDVLWYITRIVTAMERNLEEVPLYNTNKLRKRYPDGFKAERSINRTVEQLSNAKKICDDKPKEKTFKEITDKMLDIYIAKNKDYGDSFSKLRTELGDKTILVRIGDKYNRLLSLLNKDTQLVKNESIDDTLLDLANYCIMELIERGQVKQKQ